VCTWQKFRLTLKIEPVRPDSIEWPWMGQLLNLFLLPKSKIWKMLWSRKVTIGDQTIDDGGLNWGSSYRYLFFFCFWLKFTISEKCNFYHIASVSTFGICLIEVLLIKISELYDRNIFICFISDAFIEDTVT